MNHRIAEPRKGWLAFLILAIAIAGCKPGYYRRQADADAYHLVDEKARILARLRVRHHPDPRSDLRPRSDHEPMPRTIRNRIADAPGGRQKVQTLVR
jgi:hypothetical protein